MPSLAPTAQHLRLQAPSGRGAPASRLAAQTPQLQPLAGRSRLHRPRPRLAGKRTHTAAADAAAVQDDASRAHAEELVDQVLAVISDTDGGDNVSPAQRQQVDSWLRELGEIGDARAVRPLEDPLVFGNYNVAYVSAGKGQSGQPVGGRFRGTLGKLLFRTTLLAQSVLPPDLVTNKVAFRLFGFLPGSVGLRGAFVSCPDRQGGEDRQDTVKVFFEPPVLSLPADIHIRIGPPSTVVLKTTYVDERVRLGLGSRGSYFVFTRGGEADAAGMDQVGLQQCSKQGKFIMWGCVAAFMLNGAWLLAQASFAPVVRAAGFVQVILGLALGGIVSRGGIMEEDTDDRPEVQPPSAAAGQQQQQQQGGGTAAAGSSA